MTATAKGPRPEDLPAVHPSQATTLQRVAGRHRREPQKASTYNLLVGALLVLVSFTALEAWVWAAILVRTLGVVNVLVFTVQHFRRVAWVTGAGVQKELDR